MDVVKYSITKPVAVIVGVIFVLIFGFISLTQMPYQLSPTVIEPDISVTTTWPGATPYEVEREIIEEQEKVLKGIPRLVEMESSAFNGRGSITLKFSIGTDVNDALLRVSNKLDEVRSYPENVERPIITATGSATSPAIWMLLKTQPGNPRSAYTYRTYFENQIRQYLERVSGVADLFIGGGIEKEMHITVKPEKLAAYGLTISDLIRVLQSENINVSAGIMGVSRRDYRIRSVAEYRSPQDIEDIILQSSGQRRIYLRDVAQVQFGYEKLTAAILHMNQEGIVVGVRPEPAANIIELTDRVEKVVQWLNSEKLDSEKIFLDWVYDQRPYIRGAIARVQRNILIGGTFAIFVLLVFLRRISSTVVVTTAIPISVIGTFIFMNAMGRNLNVVSLAGIAFAVGMLIDNAIVVLENIDRHKKMGKSAFEAALDGAKEVRGAILASTLTTIAVFLPVVFMEEEAGQLFKDIAIAVTFAVVISLFVSISVIPMLSYKLFGFFDKRFEKMAARGKQRQRLNNMLPGFGNRLVDFIMGCVNLAVRNWKTRLSTIGSLSLISVAVTILLFPKMEYLPQGNRNLVINILIPPPGLSYEEKATIGQQFFELFQPYIRKNHNGFPGIKEMFYVGSERFNIIGAISSQEQRAGELVPLFMRQINSAIPGMRGVSIQAGIFQNRLGRGRTVEVDISGDDLNRVVQVAGMMFGALRKAIPGSQIRPVPSLELLFPEVQFAPIRNRLKAAGFSARDFGIALDVLMDGRKIGEFKQEGEKKIDLLVKGTPTDITTPEKLFDAPIAIPGGKVVPVSSLAKLQRTSGITEIRHLERQRTITLQVTPPPTLPLQAAMETIDNQVVNPLRDKGLLKGISVGQSGVADKLTETRQILQWDFLLAAVIAYLLMAILFENFIYPLIIMFTVPLAAAGGFVGLTLVNLLIAPQPLDILTMLGFVILIGVVVNNAILIVHQSLNNIRDHGMEASEAVIESTRSRLRPIYMSATTSVCGMLPLVLFPGPGSELYRGLGSVVLGGLAISTIFTVFVIPSLLMFFIKRESTG